jgi:SNF2 family DNA or RNA helicase
MDRVVRRLLADGHEVVQYHGRTSSTEKARVRELFASDAENDIKVLVGHPKSGGQGLDLSAASDIIWYSHTFDAIIREQADERATIIGGGNVSLVDLVAPGIDEYILKNITDKISIADSLAGEGMKNILEQVGL